MSVSVSLSWKTVDAVARALGATAAQRRKWRQVGRDVPPAWRIRIADALRADGAEVSFAEFDELPSRPGRLVGHDRSPA